ncbi:hypothetical protein GNX18_05475 [Microbulbifer sp. SH-1]|uniref:hypothetical protein n=1 Tax=Microbulbifer sp. SH-1 TaxID=2681547 RepID=UPI00140E700E|nr:hypothetical protein [Microbulbifer sp. SH-1]QIL89275.1 hypothetical protein GNX18_05475 [Microbulbifer sp. SH-1]
MGMFVVIGRWLLAASLVVWLTGCGGGSGGSGDSVAENPTPSEPDPSTPEEDGGDENDDGDEGDGDGSTPPEEAANEPPVASIQFPLSGSRTTGASISVRGTASDPDGDAITSVTVNGVLADTDDGFASWRVPSLSLPAGTDTLEGLVQDARGEVSSFSLTVEQVENPGPALIAPHGLAFDSANGEPRLLVADDTSTWGAGALLALELNDGPNLGRRSVIGQKGDGNGIDFYQPVGVELDTAANRALVLDFGALAYGNGKVIAVDLATQARTLLLDGLNFPLSLAFDATNNRALIGDSGNADKLLALDLDDLASGTSTVVSAGFPSSIDLDSGNPDRALMVDGLVNVEALFDVDLTAKSKTKIATFADPDVVAFDPAGGGDLAVVTDGDAFFSVNLNDGSKTLLSGTDSEGVIIGKGPRFRSIEDILFDPTDPSRLWVADGYLKKVYVVDVNSGDRSVLANSWGQGPNFFAPTQVALLPGASADLSPSLVVLDDIRSWSGSEFYRVDLTPGSALGDRVLLSGFDADNPNQIRGSGPELSWPEDLVVEADGRMLVLDGEDDEAVIVAVDTQSGDRSILSGKDAAGDLIGAGPAFNGIQSLALDAANNRLFAAQRGALFAVDLETGDRTLISAGAGEDPATDIGSGPAFTAPLSLALDADNNRLLLLNGAYSPGSGKLMSVGLATGDRVVIADSVTGAGDVMQYPVSVSLDAANNRVLMLDALSGKSAIVAVDLDTGDRSVISGYDLGPDGERNSGDEQLFGGGSPFNPEADLADAVLDAGQRILYVTDNASGSLIAVDIDSGDRVLVSGFAF